MQPYVVKQGDYLALLAHKFDFDADAIWNDPANQPLRDSGRIPEILRPTDILYIPDQVNKEPVTHPLVTGQTNEFVSDPPKVTVTMRFMDPALASQSFTIAELPELATQTLGADGTVSLVIPVTQATVTLTFSNGGDTFVFGIGCLDPVQTFSGVVQRLQNLGFLTPMREYELDDIATVRAGLRKFLASQSGTTAADLRPPHRKTRLHAATSRRRAPLRRLRAPSVAPPSRAPRPTTTPK